MLPLLFAEFGLPPPGNTEITNASLIVSISENTNPASNPAARKHDDRCLA